MTKKILLSIFSLFTLLILGLLLYAYIKREKEFAFHNSIPKTIELHSADFADGGMIPAECSGKGNNLSPSLYWNNLPKGTRSLVICMTDYDGPAPFFKIKTVEHWSVYNIPITMNGLDKGVTSTELLKDKINMGLNYTEGIEYAGPNPPVGEHRYFFRVYALSELRLELNNPKKKELMNAMENSILGYGELIGKF
jgi:Raf kinase inhibitor-like YbhB/YbcL family protein